MLLSVLVASLFLSVVDCMHGTLAVLDEWTGSNSCTRVEVEEVHHLTVSILTFYPGPIGERITANRSVKMSKVSSIVPLSSCRLILSRLDRVAIGQNCNKCVLSPYHSDGRLMIDDRTHLD